jgi:hypothetical protein
VTNARQRADIRSQMKSAWRHMGEEEKQEFIAFLFSEDLGDLLMDWGCLFDRSRPQAEVPHIVMGSPLGDWYRISEKEGA